MGFHRQACRDRFACASAAAASQAVLANYRGGHNPSHSRAPDLGTHAQVFHPPIFVVPVAPIICSCAIFGAFFLIASLGPQAIWRFSIVLGVMTFLYLVYGVHASAHHDEDMEALLAKSGSLLFPSLLP